MTKSDDHRVLRSIIVQPDDVLRHALAIDVYPQDAGIDSVGILDNDRVQRSPLTKTDTEPVPIVWKHRIDRQLGTSELESQDFLNPDTIHPPAGPGVPGPAASTD